MAKQMNTIPMITFDTGRKDAEGKSVIVRRPFLVHKIRYDNETLRLLDLYANKKLQYNENCEICTRGVLGKDLRGVPILCDCVKELDEIKTEGAKS